MTKVISRVLFAIYVFMLIWLVIFKLNFNIFEIFDNTHRSLNLIPFGAPKRVNGVISYSEMALNCLFFIPFGLLLNVNFKSISFFKKLAFILIFSLSTEFIQYAFAIGAADITDLITNTFGGLLGLVFYNLGMKFIKIEILDRIIIYIGILLFIIFMSIHLSHFFRRRLFR